MIEETKSLLADPPSVWINGEYRTSIEPGICPLDRGFMFGDGLFETLRATGKRIFYLHDHLDRLANSASWLRIRIPGELFTDAKQIILRLIEKNRLMNTTSRVKILVSRGRMEGQGLPSCLSPTICIMVQSYNPPSPDTYKRGWRLHVFREAFASPIARHKSLNYLFYLAAKQAALDMGKDEAIVLNCNGYVAETATGAIIYKLRGRWYTPGNVDNLPSITLKHVRRLLEHRVTTCPTRPEDLISADCVWVLNSLIGIMPVCEIDGHLIPNKEEKLAAHLRASLFL